MILLIAALASDQGPAPSPRVPDSELLPATYTLICQPTKSIGLDWTLGDWHSNNYKPQPFVVEKKVENDCSGKMTDGAGSYDGFAFREVCLNARNVGGRYFKYSSAKCNEFYSYKNGKWVKEVACMDANLVFYGRPDGPFRRAQIDDNLDEGPGKIQDSQFVEVGTCSLVG